MHYPKLTPIPRSRQMVDAFRGLNRNLRIGAGELQDMRNLTGDNYPVLSPRKGRQTWLRPASPQGILAKEQLCYVDGSAVVIGEVRYEMGLSTNPEDCPKQLISMGAYIIILPDKCYISTVDPEDRGSMDARYETQGPVKLTMCREDGTPMTPDSSGKEAPQSPENGYLWLDTSHTPFSLKQWSSASMQWVSVASTYVRVGSPGIGRDFSQWDGVEFKGFPQELSAFNTSCVLHGCEEDYVVVAGLLEQVTATIEIPITISRLSPRLDYALECGNRLWGCRFGTDHQGQQVNRIYASKLGDFKNWNCYMGVSTDSYYVNVGSDGPFTGAAAHLGSPLFFKENCLHKLFGSYPAEFTVQDTPCRGVQPGCHRSLAIVGEVLYYKARSCVCAYDGSLPREVSYALGKDRFHNAVAGVHGSKYYLSMEGDEGWALYVYDTTQGFWHREDDFRAGGFASLDGKLYAIDAQNMNILIFDGAQDPDEGLVSWLAQTGELGLGIPESKYISRITLRLTMAEGSEMDVYAQYDQSEQWELLCHIRGTSLRSFSVPIRPRRCDFLRLRFQGQGDMKLYAMTKTIEKGSEG